MIDPETVGRGKLNGSVKDYPYWWEAAPPRPVGENDPLPTRADVLVVGAGYSGLSVALNLARAGRHVVAIDQDMPGRYASTMNFGAVNRTIRLKFTHLAEVYGIETATRILREAKAWLDYAVAFIEREKIDCNFRRAGRVYAAHTPEAYEALARDLELQRRHLPTDSFMIPRAEQHREVGSESYFGLQLLRDVGHLHSGRYFSGLLARAQAAGVTVIGRTRADAFDRQGKDHRVTTTRGLITAKELVLCTNALTGTQHRLLRHFRRRLIPVHCWTLVTAPLDEATYRSILPTERMVLETLMLYTAMRPLDAERRLIVSAQHLFNHPTADQAAAAVVEQVALNFPQFRNARPSHCWRGAFAMTFDWLPHLGTDSNSGAHYLLGLVGTGVPSSGYFGWKLANRILGKPEGETIFADRPFPTRPFYTGNPAWLLPIVRGYYRRRDLRERRRALARHGAQRSAH